MDVRTRKLDNGLVVATEVIPHLRSVSIGVWIRSGSRSEPESSAGISHFIEHLLFKGTTTRSAAQIAEAVDSVGGQLNAFTDREYVGFYAKVLDRHLAFGFELLSDIVANPTFPAAEIRRERNVIFEEINMVEDSPQELVHDLFMEYFWKGHPLGRPISGTKESVAAITRPQVTRFFRENYTACNTLVAVAGHISHDRVYGLAARHFRDLLPGKATDPGGAPGIQTGHTFREKPNLEQTHLCLGLPSPTILCEDRFGAHVLCNILGGGMSSRLFQNIREKRGLVYSIYSTLNLYRDAGTLLVYAGAAPDKAPRVLDLTLRELKRLRDRRVPSEELKRAKQSIAGSILLSLESSSSRMTHLAQQQIYYDRFQTAEEIIRSFERVRRADVLRLANDMFDSSRLALTTLGSEAIADIESVPLQV